MRVLTIRPGAPFAETLARGLIARLGAEREPLALAACTIYLPTRRATRALGDVFARVLGGAALLPSLRALGDIDEDEMLFDPSTDDLNLPPAIAPIRRRLLLANLVQGWSAARGNHTGFAQSAALAKSLAHFLDEAQTQNADLSKLEDLAPAALAEHWAEVRDFLVLLRDEWPKLLAAEGAIDPATHRNASLEALAKRIAEKPPAGPVIAAGSTGSIPATAVLLGVIADLPQGSVVLPGLDRESDDESWLKLDPGHPQYGMKQLLLSLRVPRERVEDWQPSPPASPAREALLRETLRPAPTTDAWRALAESGGGEVKDGVAGITLIEAAHPGEEAASIALVLRHALETKRHTAALVTPDRNLARRVAAEMERWGIAIDDSAGRPLAKTPPGAFLVLLAQAVESEFAPVPLLALLKHPLAAGNEAPAEFRAKARLLDRAVLRGPRPDPGLAGVQDAIARAGNDALASWFKTLAHKLRPFEALLSEKTASLPDIVEAHLDAAEALAQSDIDSGAERMWRGDAGEAAQELFSELRRDAEGVPEIEPRAYPALFAELAEERPVRPAFGRHPRLAILGPLEARLLHFDTVVLGGLNEGGWPRAPTADPWLSRPMRTELGLESPERAIGLAAHDFATLAAGARVFLTRALKAEGAPTVPSRWLQRLIQITKGLELNTQLEDQDGYVSFARALNAPGSGARMKKPQPRPPVEARPRGLSVTEVETWLRDPYAIYAKHVLRLRPLDSLDDEVGPSERGTAIHAALEAFLRETPSVPPDELEHHLIAIGDRTFARARIPKATLALWRPRFERAARWFAGIEREWRAAAVQSFVELKGRREFTGPAGVFALRCRADRIDKLAGGDATVIDYKTGRIPSKKQVAALLAPQLPLEALILRDGGFTETGALATARLLYVGLSGGAEAGEVREVGENVAALIVEAEEKFAARVAYFDDPETPYPPRVRPERSTDVGDYDHLSRVREWSLSGWDGEDE